MSTLDLGLKPEDDIFSTGNYLTAFQNWDEVHAQGLHLCDRAFLDDFLVAPLHRAVPREQGGTVAVLVTQQLHFQVTRGSSQLHGKNRRSRHLSLDLAAQDTDVEPPRTASHKCQQTAFHRSASGWRRCNSSSIDRKEIPVFW